MINSIYNNPYANYLKSSQAFNGRKEHAASNVYTQEIKEKINSSSLTQQISQKKEAIKKNISNNDKITEIAGNINEAFPTQEDKFIASRTMIMNANTYGYSPIIMGTSVSEFTPMNSYNYSKQVIGGSSGIYSVNNLNPTGYNPIYTGNEGDRKEAVSESLQASPLNTYNYDDELVSQDLYDITPGYDTYEEQEDEMYENYSKTSHDVVYKYNAYKYNPEIFYNSVDIKI